MAKVKTNLQALLEAEGWRFLTNESIDYDLVRSDIGAGPYRSGVSEFRRRNIPLTDADLLTRFKENGFSEVLVEDAYDINGKSIGGYRAIYVKGEPNIGRR